MESGVHQTADVAARQLCHPRLVAHSSPTIVLASRISPRKIMATASSSGTSQLSISSPASRLGLPAVRPVRNLADAAADAERQAIESAMLATGGKKLPAAKLLGISRATLYEKLASLGMN